MVGSYKMVELAQRGSVSNEVGPSSYHNVLWDTDIDDGQAWWSIDHYFIDTHIRRRKKQEKISTSP